MINTTRRQGPNPGCELKEDILPTTSAEALSLERPSVAWDWMRQTRRAPTGTSWLRPQVLKAWARCIEDYRLPTGYEFSPRMVSFEPPTEIDQALLANLPEMVYSLRPLFHDDRVTLLLSDFSGKVIEVLDAGLHIGVCGRDLLRVGVDWGESSLGNNGIGTSSLLREPVAFEGMEHFAKALHPFTTAGCPIFSPNGEVRAIIGMVTDRPERLKLILGFLQIASQTLEACLFERSSSKGLLLRLRYTNGFEASTSHACLIDGKALVSEAGRIEGVNRSFLELSGYSDHSEVLGKSVSTIIGADFLELSKAASHGPARQHFLPQTKRHIEITAFNLDNGAEARRDRDLAADSLQPSAVEHVLTDTTVSQAWRDVILESALEKAAAWQERNLPILVTGESGVGKDYFVRQLHANGPRRAQPLVVVNCATISHSFIEDELFGHGERCIDPRVKGKAGKLLTADKGVLYLDEACDLPLDVQAKLLRVLDSSEISLTGSDRSIQLDVHVVVGANCRLLDMIGIGSFRRDLYYRLNGVQIRLPPLRERPDRLRLIERLLHIEQEGQREAQKILSDDVRTLFFRHPWPGNIRQAQNVLRSSIAVASSQLIGIDHLPYDFLNEADFDLSPQLARINQADASNVSQSRQSDLSDWEEQAVRSALALSEGNVAKAARNLGITRATLYNKMNRYGMHSTRRPVVKR